MFPTLARPPLPEYTWLSCIRIETKRKKRERGKKGNSVCRGHTELLFFQVRPTLCVQQNRSIWLFVCGSSSQAKAEVLQGAQPNYKPTSHSAQRTTCHQFGQQLKPHFNDKGSVLAPGSGKSLSLYHLHSGMPQW